MTLLAQADGPYELPSFAPWEIHPGLAHFPIAFLLGGVVLDLYAAARGRPTLFPVATGLLAAGVFTAVLTAAAGLLAWYTLPTMTDRARELIWWHLGVQASAAALFVGATWRRWRLQPLPPTAGARLVGCLGAVLLVVGSSIGGYLVYREGLGIEPLRLSPPTDSAEVLGTDQAL